MGTFIFRDFLLGTRKLFMNIIEKWNSLKYLSAINKLIDLFPYSHLGEG
jgi:hypothetical protein